ncbi:MAG TPA: S-layer homology domain-containing protein [Chloroflexia bacterium]|nr:S-layer homology domain-containing protein [Chloroflexia bacterium]
MHTSVPTYTAIATSTPTAIPCSMQFVDVHPGDYFYNPVRYLYCEGFISGYVDNSFRPWNVTTRAQLAKIVVSAKGWQLLNPQTPTFTDVPAGSTFYHFIETAAAQGIITGYPCGNPEPCDTQSRPYFRPNAEVTRGQLTKIIVAAQGWPLLDPQTPRFADVEKGSTFYTYIESGVSHGIIAGYPCGNPEPCDPQARPYFRPGNPATRGQIARIVYNAITSP